MGKSNKFDYTNRTSGGAKLGGIIGRDAEKEADKVIKDAEKQSAKPRKSSIGSYSISDEAGAGHTDSCYVHALDIKAPSKQLGDEGACAMAAGLEAALKKGTSAASVELEDLNLSDNGITTVTLARLAPVIDAARHHLKTLNFADNDIRVETDQQAAEWERFLRSFARCYKLRRLDLSGNINFGSRALEIFARVHCQEPYVDPIPTCGRQTTCSISSTWGDVDEEGASPTVAPHHDKMTSGGILRRRCGLRGIPYITLINIGLTDAGALWLSYILEEHHLPEQLTDPINAPSNNSKIETYGQGFASGGLDWDVSELGLGKDGLQLLKKTDAVRRQVMAENVSMAGSSMYDSCEIPRSRTGDRRASLRPTTSANGGEQELSEVESLRKKLQRHIIANTGAEQTELWRAGLRMAVSSTVLSGLGPSTRDYEIFYTGPPLFHYTNSGKRGSQPTTPTRNDKNAHPAHCPSQPQGSLRQGTYAQTLTLHTGAAAGEPELAITDVTNSPVTPKVIFKPHRKGAFSDGSDLQTVSQKLDGLIMRDNNPRRFVRCQVDMIDRRGGNIAFRNSAVPSQLPQDVMDRIVGYTVSEHEMDILSSKQRRAACAWGQDRANFEKAESWRKLPDSSQVVSLLECIGCLAYQSE
ncbi:Putative leucine-rich repeat domain superfamily [Septoria linicola]|uniref:Leucine-rich repeat domain superfamily n=1 Tax=Septoria linicola TaxID=215465 RepID=A0A9Q9EHL8_9PEZI|nr:Putative leucine-rich repeat domain superfamily [Septoria linicola]